MILDYRGRVQSGSHFRASRRRGSITLLTTPFGCDSLTFPFPPDARDQAHLNAGKPVRSMPRSTMRLLKINDLNEHDRVISSIFNKIGHFRRNELNRYKSRCFLRLDHDLAEQFVRAPLTAPVQNWPVRSGMRHPEQPCDWNVGAFPNQAGMLLIPNEKLLCHPDCGFSAADWPEVECINSRAGAAPDADSR